MATRTTNGKRLGKVNTWGIAITNLDGSYGLVGVFDGRAVTRAVKRETYPGPAYKVVRVQATLTGYNK